ncbi:MAG: nucleotidyl transferase AbiEii/AbiGii toxin family protein [Betaproteobacteria bacterium]
MRHINSDATAVWQTLFSKALVLIDEVETRTGAALFWTFGGGTVLMLRHNHRQSKDIDIFVPDPQSLGFMSPRLNEIAESLTTEYEETAGHLKLYFAEGEIDFVASPNLTSPGYESETIQKRSIKLETDVEIIAKKMWHRGDQIKARDLFDLSLVIEQAENDLRCAEKFLIRHRATFLRQLTERESILRVQFGEIDTLQYQPSYDHCVTQVTAFLRSLSEPG